MSEGQRYALTEAKFEANTIIEMIGPYCDRIAIAGSIRREKDEVGDIEIVCIPAEIMGGLFADEPMRDPRYCAAVDSMAAIKGKATGKYAQRVSPNGITVDIFMAEAKNWGNIMAIRTGSADFSAKRLAARWVQLGYHSSGGVLHKDGVAHECREEMQLFELLGIEWIEPKDRV